MVDVIILTHKPDLKLKENIAMLMKQDEKPDHIFIVNTDQKEFGLILDKDDDVEIVHIAKEEFDHGRTRNNAVRMSNAKYFLFMTQDAICIDEHVIGNMLKGFSEYENVALVYARQVPKSGGLIEEYTRKFNYPESDILKDKSTKEKYGIKNIFASNVCAMYDRSIFDKIGGFQEGINFNEDTIYAHYAIEAGYKVLYKADAKVFHTHDYTARQQYERNYQIGLSHRLHREVFGSYKTVSEGKKLVIETAKYILNSKEKSIFGKLYELFKLVNISIAKYRGFRAGYKSLDT